MKMCIHSAFFYFRFFFFPCLQGWGGIGGRNSSGRSLTLLREQYMGEQTVAVSVTEGVLDL